MTKNPDSNATLQVKLDVYKEQVLELKNDYLFKVEDIDKKIDKIDDKVSLFPCAIRGIEMYNLNKSIENLREDQRDTDRNVRNIFYTIIIAVFISLCSNVYSNFKANKTFKQMSAKSVIEQTDKNCAYADTTKAKNVRD